MPSISESWSSTSRCSTFSFGNSPVTAGLRINSFIDRQWKLLPDIQALSHSLYGFDANNEKRLATPSAKSISHRRFSSVDPYRFSIFVKDDDYDLHSLGPETPAVETARVQIQKAAPVRNLVYVPKSNTASKSREIGNAARSTSGRQRYIKETQATSTLFDLSGNGATARELVPAPLRPRTVHSSRPSLSGTLSSDSIEGNLFPSPPKTPIRPIRHGQHRRARGHSPNCKRVHRNFQHPQKREVWPCQYSPVRASKVVPPVPARISSLNAAHSFAVTDSWEEGNVFETTPEDIILPQSRTIDYQSGLGPPIHFKTSQTYTPFNRATIPMEKRRDDRYVTPESDVPSSVSRLPENSPGNDTTVSNATTLCESWPSVDGPKDVMSKSRLRRWWGKCFRHGTHAK